MLVERKDASDWRSSPITSTHEFPRKFRLTQKHQFDHVLSTRSLHVRVGAIRAFASANDGECARLGLIVAKRQLKRAVDRNRAKRVLRESFRHARRSLPAADIVVQLVSTAPVEAIAKSANELWIKLIDEARHVGAR